MFRTISKITVMAGAFVLAALPAPLMAQSDEPSTPPAISASNWRQELGVLRVGMIQAHLTDPSPTAKAKIEEDFAAIVKMPVELILTRDFPTLIEGQIAGRIDYAIYSASAYATAQLLCKCIEPLVAPVAENGAEGLRAYLFANAAKLTNLIELPQRKIGWIKGDNVASALLPRFGLTIAGKPVMGDEPFMVPLTNEAEAIEQLNAGTLDGLFAWGQGNARDDSGVVNAQNRLAALGLAETDLVPLWKSDFLRFGPHSVLKKIPLEARNDIIAALTNLRNQNPVLYELLDETLGGGFQAVTESEYAPVISMVGKLSANP